MAEPTVITSWVIDQRKLEGYLLNSAHPKGASKAKYLAAFGYSIDQADWLATDVAKHAIANWPGREVVPEVGLPRLVFEGEMEMPDGRLAKVRTVWEMVSTHEARFITLVPLTK